MNVYVEECSFGRVSSSFVLSRGDKLGYDIGMEFF